MNQKGFFFTLLVFIFFFLVLISVTAWTRMQESREEQVVTAVRVTRMNEFSSMVREDAKRITHLVGLNALKVAASYVAFNNDSRYLDNSQCFERLCLYELMYNGTIERKENYTKSDGYVNFTSTSQMGNLLLKNWDDQILTLANRSEFNVNMSRQNISIYQSDSWNVKIGYNLHFNISDKALDTVFRREVIPVLVTIPLTNYTYPGG